MNLATEMGGPVDCLPSDRGRVGWILPGACHGDSGRHIARIGIPAGGHGGRVQKS